MGNDLEMGLKWFGISMTDTFGLNQFAPMLGQAMKMGKCSLVRMVMVMIKLEYLNTT